MPVARAIEGDGDFAMFMAVSAVAAAGGRRSGVHVGGRPLHEKLFKVAVELLKTQRTNGGNRPTQQ
jgi:hypothetical protein